MRQVLRHITKKRRPVFGNPTTVTAAIFTLPSTIYNGQLTVGLSGNTVTNLLGSYGDFEVDTNADGIADGWSKTAGITPSLSTSNVVCGAKSQRIQAASASGAGQYISIPYSFITGNKYYIRVSYKNVNALTGEIGIYTTIDISGRVSRQSAPSAGQSGIFSAVRTALAADVDIKFYVYDAAAAVDVYIDAFMVINLTALGLDATVTTATQGDARFNFINDTHSTVGGTIFSGKNIFGGVRAADKTVAAVNNATYAYKTTIDGRNCLALLGNNALLNKNCFSYFEPLTQYTIQFYGRRAVAAQNGGLFKVYYTDGTTSAAISIPNDTWTKSTLTTTTGKTISGIYLDFGGAYLNYIDYDTLQVEKGTTASDVTQEYTVLTYPDIGNSLPNGTKDEVSVVNGVWTKTQRIDVDSDISSTDYASIDTTTYTNYDVVITTAFSLAAAGVAGTAEGSTRYFDKNGNQLTELAGATDNVSEVGKYYYGTDKKLYIIVAKGAYADIAAARTGLGTTSLNYQLSAFKETIADVTGDELIAYPNGTIIISMLDGSALDSTTTVPTTTYRTQVG